MAKSYVKQLIKNNIAFIEFFTPDHNAMPSPILKELAQVITTAGKDEKVKVIVLKSGGDRTFCAGASFKELVAINNLEEGEQFFLGFANVINAMRTCEKTIIGRVQGKAVGGGVGLACATDYCLATQSAAIKLSELSIGIGPFVIEPVVSKKLGATTFAQMTIDAEHFFSAEFAKEKGLYANVFDTVEALDEEVNNLANKLASYNPEALSELKKVLWQNTENWDALLKERAKISGTLVLSHYTKEKLASYQ